MMEQTKPCGEFLIRIDRNFKRLEEEEYTPEYIRRNAESGYSWPGDWEGRIILALALHHKATGKQPVYLQQLINDVRGILRLYQATGNELYLNFAERFLRLYVRNGMTENFMNYNWFRRPDWTEPCAIVDSYLLAVELYKLTKKASYPELSNRILFNTLLASKRANGGFG